MLRLFHPVLFYPAALVLAVLIIAFGAQPQKWPRPAAPVAGIVSNGALVLQRDAFSTPDRGPEQNMMVVRDFLGRAQSLRIGVLPNQQQPSPAEHGVRILLTPDSATAIAARPVIVEVSYTPFAFNGAEALAVSIQGAGPTHWVSQPIAPQAGQLRFDLPAQTDVSAIGLRAIMPGEIDKAYGLEITQVRVRPAA